MGGSVAVVPEVQLVPDRNELQCARATMVESKIGSLSERELLNELALIVATERRTTARLIALLMEVDARKLYLGEGFSSLFTYCTQVLHIAEHAAYNRIEAARAAQRFPLALDMMKSGDVTLTAVRVLAPHLTPANHREMLERARHKSKRDVELLVAALQPLPDVPTVVRRLPVRDTPRTVPLAPLLQPADGAAGALPEIQQIPSATAPVQVPTTGVRPRTDMKALAPERYKVQFTASREAYDKLRRAQALLRHVIPDGDPALIIERALALLVSELERRKTGATDRPRSSVAADRRTRHIPAAVKRAVWERDAGRCAFVGALGRCTETGLSRIPPHPAVR
jgi:hypothetical protein